MPTVTITEQLYDAGGQPDNAPWSFYSRLRDSDPAGSVITAHPVIATPVNGVLTVELEPGPMTAQHRGVEYNFTVPATDSELWPLISAAVNIPPGTPQDTLAVAVSDYMQAHPPVTQAGIVGETINYNYSTGLAPPASNSGSTMPTPPWPPTSMSAPPHRTVGPCATSCKCSPLAAISHSKTSTTTPNITNTTSSQHQWTIRRGSTFRCSGRKAPALSITPRKLP